MENLKLDKKQLVEILQIIDERVKAAEILYKENLYRDSLSRSYYAFFEIVSALLAAKGIISKTHKGGLQQFSLHFIKPKLIDRKYAKIMAQLMEKRGEADYEFYSIITQKEAREALKNVKEFKRTVEKSINILFGKM